MNKGPPVSLTEPSELTVEDFPTAAPGSARADRASSIHVCHLPIIASPSSGDCGIDPP
jgi:hypothetical protein